MTESASEQMRPVLLVPDQARALQQTTFEY
jgi:hypothetical protein